MNEKLKAILLQLATVPLSLQTIQNSLASLSNDGLEDWETQLKDAVRRPQAVKNISDALRCLFSLVPPAKQAIVTNELLKPIILTQAKLPPDQRDPNFYSFLYACSNQHRWQKDGSWLIKTLIELPINELSLILNQASSAEFYQLFTYFKDTEVLEKLPAEVFLIFLQKLSLDVIKELPLAEMAQRSGTVWDALANWFNQVAVNPPLGFWEFVKAQQLIKIAGFVNFLAMKSGTTLDFSKFSINNLHTDGPDNYLSGLIESDNKLKFCQSTPANQMLAYGLLAVCLGRNQVLLKEIQTNTNSLNGELTEQRIESLTTLKSRYEATSSFLKLIAEAKIFPRAIVDTLKHSLNLSEQDVTEYLQIAGFLPRSSGAGVTKLEAEALKPKPKPVPSATSSMSMPPPPYPGSSNTNTFTLPLFSPSPLPLPFFSSPTNRTTTAPQINPSFSPGFNFQTNFVSPVIIDDEQGNDSDGMKVNIISYVTSLDGYGANEQGVLIDRATALYQANKTNNPEIDAEGWVLQAIAAQSESNQPKPEKPEKEEKKRKRSDVSSPPLIVFDDEGEDVRAKQEKTDLELAKQLDRQEKENSNRRTTYPSSGSSYRPTTTTAQTGHYPSLPLDDEEEQSLGSNFYAISEQQDFELAQNLQEQEGRRAATRRRFGRPTGQNQSQQPFSAQPRQLITQPRQPEPFQLNPAVTIPVAIVLSLILALALCFSPVGAPLWLIPVLIVSGIYVATIFTLLFNCISKWSHTPPPSAPGIGYSEESEDAPYYPYSNPGLGPQSGNRYGNNALGFSQNDFWEPEDATNQSDSRTLAYDPENDYDNNFELIQ